MFKSWGRGRALLLLLPILLLPSLFLYSPTLYRLETRVLDQVRASRWHRKLSATSRNLKILIYITTHLSKQHVLYLQSCWPRLFARSRLFRQAHLAIFLTNEGGAPLNITLIHAVFPPNKVKAIYVHPNPGHQEGATLAMNQGFERGYFDGYDWVIRVNPDVLIRNDTWLLNTFQDQTIHGVFADCGVNAPKESS
jgi:hypothetical protein